MNLVANVVHFSRLMLRYFREGKDICAVDCDSAIAESNNRKGFTRFGSRKFNRETVNVRTAF